MKMQSAATRIGILLGLAFAGSAALACSRVTWLGPDGLVVTGRSMDWPYAFNTHFYIYPRGTRFDGAGGPNTLHWTSKYGTVVLAGTTDPAGPIDGVFDGMNERGMAANLLYLAETDFGPAPAGDKPRVSFSAWTQYVLSSYATVAEVVKAFETDPVYIVPVHFGPGRKAAPTVHLAVSDPSGDSAVVEYLAGKPVIHHGRQYQVMTNSPTYGRQLALNAYWRGRDGSNTLPGSHQSDDRFVRASYYLGRLPQTRDVRQAVAGVLSVMRNVSVPWQEADKEHPNLAPTFWRSVLDQKNLLYYFESTLSPNIVWVDLSNIDFAPDSGIRSLRVEGNDEAIGNMTGRFQPARPISFLAP
ncbi:MAG: linear amide C-N hydrolase [Isosphaeraceae bacterium]